MKAARGHSNARRSLPRFCHESNRTDLIEADAGEVRTRRITRFQLTSITNDAISNPSVSATSFGPRSLGKTGIAGFSINAAIAQVELGVGGPLAVAVQIPDSVSNHIDTMSDDIQKNAASMREVQRLLAGTAGATR